MNKDTKQFDVQTAMKLLAPQEEGIVLVPLSEVEQPQTTLFWAAIFFGIFTAILGSLVSLLTTAYDNTPVIYILGLFLVSYLAFFIVFTFRGFARRRNLRNKAVGGTTGDSNSFTERLSRLENRIFLYKVHADLGVYVFAEGDTMSFEDFNRKVDAVMPFDQDDHRRQKFNQKLLTEGMVRLDKTDNNNWTVTYNPDYEVSV